MFSVTQNNFKICQFVTVLLLHVWKCRYTYLFLYDFTYRFVQYKFYMNEYKYYIKLAYTYMYGKFVYTCFSYIYIYLCIYEYACDSCITEFVTKFIRNGTTKFLWNYQSGKWTRNRRRIDLLKNLFLHFW